MDLNAKWQFVDLFCRNRELLNALEKKTNVIKILLPELVWGLEVYSSVAECA